MVAGQRQRPEGPGYKGEFGAAAQEDDLAVENTGERPQCPGAAMGVAFDAPITAMYGVGIGVSERRS